MDKVGRLGPIWAPMACNSGLPSLAILFLLLQIQSTIFNLVGAIRGKCYCRLKDAFLPTLWVIQWPVTFCLLYQNPSCKTSSSYFNCISHVVSIIHLESLSKKTQLILELLKNKYIIVFKNYYMIYRVWIWIHPNSI